VTVIERPPSTTTAGAVTGRLGDSITRPDGVAKVQGSFEFSSDLNAENCLWGATLRSPHPSARIVSIDVTPAYAISGVEAIITADDVPGQPTYGLISQDQPVFARDVVRYVGEPIAAVAAIIRRRAVVRWPRSS
jgi:CO/xanthine dehydrogenase Mo-binding subunit